MGLAQSHARLRWEISCERLRNALAPPNGAPAATAAEKAAALQAVRDSLKVLDDVFGISALAGDGGTDSHRLGVAERAQDDP